MRGATYTSVSLEQIVLDDLLISIRNGRTLWRPRTGTDGVCRLQPVNEGQLPSIAVPTFLPLKKLLLPPREEIWAFQNGRFYAAEEPGAFTVVGISLCDLQAVWYLDQVFAEDAAYQARRAQALLVGMPCEPGPECRCDEQLMPLAGDLFVGQERVWALSPKGLKLLQRYDGNMSCDTILPWPEDLAERRHEITEELYHSALDATVWAEEAQRCLSCGACSAVCPTCYCFDMLDSAALDGTVTRQRAWDNCFFAEHGKVAGGHDFRPGRADRLRFRMEHKRFGFGALHGQNSCVGCGRCRGACPVDIDLDRIAEQLGVEAAP